MLEQVIKREQQLLTESVLTLKTLLVLTAKEKNIEPMPKKQMLMILSHNILKRHSRRPPSAKFLSEMLWWLAVCDFKDDELLRRIEELTRRIITEMNSRDLTYCFFAFGKYFNMELNKKKNPYREILDILSERITELKRTFNKRSNGIIKETLEKSGYKNEKLQSLFKN
jgi:hypothetical protein